MRYLIALMVMGLFTFATGAIASEGHNHEASVESGHLGGTLRDAPPFKAELLMDKDHLKVYVYDKDRKIIKLDKETLTGDVQYPRQEKATTLTFKREKEAKPKEIKGFGTITEYYLAKLPAYNGPKHRYDMHVNLVVGDQKAKADFGIDNIH